MAVDKSLMQVPMGPPPMGDDDPLDIMMDTAEDDGEGGVIVTLGDAPKEKGGFDANLAEELDDGVLTALATTLLADYEADEQSRKDWLETYIKGLELLGLKYEERTDPWKGACGVQHPLLMEAAVRFQSETMMETFPAAGPVRAKILGRETQEKKDAATRVEADMNYRLTEQMREYRPEHERLLMNLCLSGNGFKKVYFDPSLGRQTAMFVGAEDIVVPYGAANLESAERVTHKMRKTKNEVTRLQMSGFYRDIELPEPLVVPDAMEKARAKEQGYEATNDKRYQLLEMHVNCDIPGYEDESGLELPYVITIDKGSNQILAIRRNWLEDDKLKLKRNHFVHYGYIPGFGFYYFGLIHLIGGHAKAGTSLLRQLVDSGTLANIPGGFKAKGMRSKMDNQPIAPGEWIDVDLPSGAIRDNILPLPYKEPSATLLQLMDRIIEDGRRYASVADIKISDMSSQAPVGTTLAILERTLKVMSAVQARVHYAMRQEFKLLKNIIRDNTSDEYEYEPETGEEAAKGSDYDMVEIIPVSDPNSTTMSQRVVQYQAVLELSKTAPQIYDLPFLHRQMIETLGVKNASKIVPSVEDMKPVDPVSENMAILNGKPVKAFIYQDHEAHLQVHLAAIQDPKIQQMVGQNPQAQLIQGSAMAHIMEHVAFQYRREIEKMLGASLPPMPEQAEGDEEAEHILPPEIEVQLSQMAAMAAAKLLQKDQAEAAMMAQQQAMQDPVMQMQMKDLEIKEREAGRKERKDLLDAAAKADAQKLKEQETSGRLQLEALKTVLQMAKDQDTLTQQQEMELLRIATDMAKEQDRMDSQERQGARQSMEGDKQRDYDMQKHGAEMADRAAARDHDMQKHGSSLADRAEDRKARSKAAPKKTSKKTAK